MTAATAERAPRPDGSQTAQSFELVYRECVADVFRYVSSLLRDRSAAEDVTALAFERAFRRRRLYNPRKGSQRMWIFGIARNAALDELRRRARTTALTADAHAADTATDHDPYGDPERRVAVRAALANLSPAERELVLLKFHAQLSNRELARALGITESNAGTRLHRALQALRKACDAPA